MKKQLLILGAVFFGTMAYSQNKTFGEKDLYKSSGSSIQNSLLAVEDGTLQIAGTGSLQIFAGSSLTVKNKITNLGNGDNFVIESDGNLVQIDDAVNVGNANVKRAVKIGPLRAQYNYFGTPVDFKTGQSFKTIYPGITYVLYHNEASNFFSSSSGVNIPGRGLAVKEPILAAIPSTSEVKAVFQGVAQNGLISYPLTNKNSAVSTWGYNLVGNPYPSNIDLKKLYNSNGGQAGSLQKASLYISPTFYFWDNTNNAVFDQQGSNYNGQSYALFNVLAGPTGTGLGSPSAIGSKVPTNIITVGQGFMVRALVPSYNFSFNNKVRTVDNAAPAFLGKSSTSETTDRYWLKMTAPSQITSSLAVVYYPEGNDLFGLEDSRTMNASDEIYSIVENENISINAKSDFSPADKVLVGTKHFVSGNYVIALGDKEGVFEAGQAVYLKDRQTGIITDLSNGSYTFDAVAGESQARFEVIYRPETVLATGGNSSEPLLVYKDGTDFVISSQTKKITDLEVYDTAGRLIFKLQPNQTSVIISAEQFVRGVYLLKIIQDGQIITKKIIK